MTRSPAIAGAEVILVLPEIAQVDAAREIDLPVDAEASARRPGLPVQGDETRIEGAHEDAQAARAPGAAIGSRQAETPRDVTSE